MVMGMGIIQTAIRDHPSDPTEWFDTDGDGVGNNADAFPNNPTQNTDTMDGYGDSATGQMVFP